MLQYIWMAISLVSIPVAAASSQQILFSEDFEDAKLDSRGWYDNSGLVVTTAEHLPAGVAAAEFHFRKGATTPASGGAVRRKFAASESVYLRYWVKYSANWEGSNKPYHPHEFHFITDVDGDYIGPAATHLTTYIEQNEGRPMLAIQDALNIDETKIGQTLAGITESRAVAGCNGSSDRYPTGDCYLSGSTHRNGKSWKSPGVTFTDSAGTHDKNIWHCIEAYFRLNSIVSGIGIADGIVRYWYDGEPLIDAQDAMLRTGAHPAMKFNQFLIAPYIGDGSPVDQTMWVDELVVATGRLPISSVDEVTLPRSVVVRGIYPNPFRDASIVEWTLANAGRVLIQLCDPLGRVRSILSDELMEAGPHLLRVHPPSGGAGLWYLRFLTPGAVTTTTALRVD